jgi:hypothetical protein
MLGGLLNVSFAESLKPINFAVDVRSIPDVSDCAREELCWPRAGEIEKKSEHSPSIWSGSERALVYAGYPVSLQVSRPKRLDKR